MKNQTLSTAARPVIDWNATREWADAQGDPDAWKTWWQDSGGRCSICTCSGS